MTSTPEYIRESIFSYFYASSDGAYFNPFIQTLASSSDPNHISEYLTDQLTQHCYAGVFSSFEAFFYPFSDSLKLFQFNGSDPSESLNTPFPSESTESSNSDFWESYNYYNYRSYAPLNSYISTKILTFNFDKLIASLIHDELILVFNKKTRVLNPFNVLEDPSCTLFIFFNPFVVSNHIHQGDIALSISLSETLIQIANNYIQEVSYQTPFVSIINEQLEWALKKRVDSTSL